MTGLRASGPRRLVAARRVASLPGDGLKRHGCFTAGRRVVFSVRVAVNVTMAVRTGLQEWPDGSRFEGQFVDGMKQGAGLYVWPSGESYEGSFYKDYRHGNGIYSWPDGSRFTGKFYLNRKESYGVQLCADGTVFKGLYHADEHFGPGVVTYPDGRQDVGFWHRQHLIQLCSCLEGGFTITAFPEYSLTNENGPHEKLLGASHSSLPTPYQDVVPDESFVLPVGIQRYSTDSDHLPLPQGMRQDLDRHFFRVQSLDAHPELEDFRDWPLQERMQAHILRHRFEADGLDWDVAAVLSKSREGFGPKGPLETMSEQLIREASLGNARSVWRFLCDGNVHPNVGDALGHTALMAAVVNCHSDVIHLLLDRGADVNKPNSEGMTPLAICSVLHYPFQSLCVTVAEKKTQKVRSCNLAASVTPRLKQSASKILTSLSSNEWPLFFTDVLTNISLQKLHSPLKSPQIDNDINVSDSSGDKRPENGNEHGSPEEVSPDEVLIHSEENESADQKDAAGEDIQHQISQDTEAGRDESTRVDSLLETQDINLESTSDVEPESPWCDEYSESLENISIEDKSEEDLNQTLVSFHIQVTEDVAQKMTETLCQPGLVQPVHVEEMIHKISPMKSVRCTRWAIITLLLKRGADPNACLVPMPVLFLAIKAGHVEAVRRLLDCGARADLPLPPEQNGLYPLHVAAGLCGDAAPKITELLLHALANPDAQAGDAHEIFEPDKILSQNTDSFSQLNMLPQPAPPEGGRTALHIACQRQDDHANVRDVVSLLLSHKARTDLLWSGHSPLSLAIANGNELAVDVLLRGGADPNLVLSHRVGSALCANANITYEATCHPSKRAGMLQKLISAGANILVPVLVSEGRRCIVGTAVDYAHFAFQQDKRIAHTPYHALNPSERETFIARRHLLSLMGGFMRQAALTMERHQLEQEREQEQGLGTSSACPGQKFVFTGAGARTPPAKTRVPEDRDGTAASQLEQRKPLFKYCYQCGRSALVVLVPCTRCRHVFYCSSNCKMKAWDECHKDECVRVPGSSKPRPGRSTRNRSATQSQASVGEDNCPSGKRSEAEMLRKTKGSNTKERQNPITDLQENYSFV
ncbi:ankyrin repeat and MYND domain-containing protein 1 [Denticeps clupeoides]|uniref:ankyrin repeat and MYND domain-containing protein 1 n=1 Tax=Denticeps clupeoides TaxID=299321 RepID=UPI0010A4C755|nr:ankyrin repeat and MYND domain-containing protein 1 [Denticeps clupeoides]